MDMQIAHYWADVFGPFLVILGLWMLLYSDNLGKIVTSIKGSPASFHILGLLQLLIGLILVRQCNVWNMTGVVLVTLLGWVFLVRGILSLFFPQLLMKFIARGKWTKFAGIIPLVWGVLMYWTMMS